MKNQIVILAAGKGKRLGRKDLPKVLLPLRGKPLIQYLLDSVAKLDKAIRPIIVVGYKHGLVKEQLGKNYVYALQREQLGTAHAVWSARDKIKAKNILVLYGDMPLIKTRSLEKLLRLHEDRRAVISMFIARVPNFSGPNSSFLDYGRIIRDKFNNIARIVEFRDASPAVRKIREINPGIYSFSTTWLWDNIDKIQTDNVSQEFYLTDIIEVAIREGRHIYSLPIDSKEILGINTLAQLKQAEQML